MTRKLFTLALFAVLGITSSFAMSRERASEEADFLTDKMAYELDLSEAQWSDVYEINYDYFRVLDRLGRSYARESQLRDSKLRYVLSPSQWARYCAITYFTIPVRPGATDWIFDIYSHYNRDRFFFNSRHIVDVYRGDHRRGAEFYQNRYQSRERPGFSVSQPNMGGAQNRGGNVQMGGNNYRSQGSNMGGQSQRGGGNNRSQNGGSSNSRGGGGGMRR